MLALPARVLRRERAERDTLPGEVPGQGGQQGRRGAATAVRSSVSFTLRRWLCPLPITRGLAVTQQAAWNSPSPSGRAPSVRGVQGATWKPVPTRVQGCVAAETPADELGGAVCPPNNTLFPPEMLTESPFKFSIAYPQAPSPRTFPAHALPTPPAVSFRYVSAQKISLVPMLPVASNTIHADAFVPG